MSRRNLLFLFTFLVGVLAAASPASAHNTLVSSDPADGARYDVVPTQLTLVFDKSVPLDTLTIEIIAPNGVRTDLAGSTHAPGGDTVVVTPLPVLSAGPVNLRWRLVGPDGHPITGRIEFTVATAVVATVTPPVVAGEAVPSSPEPTAAVDTGFEDPWTTPDAVRWLLRYGSYLAIMAIGGAIATTAFVWRGAWNHPTVRRAVGWALAATFSAAIAQLLVIASDVEASPPWAAGNGVSAALGTDAGRALVIRVVMVGALAWIMFIARTLNDSARWMWSVGLILGLLATWAYAGHSRSMRWPWLGVPVDVAHQAAAAAWIGGLAIIGIVAIKECRADELVEGVNRFARVAATSVTVIVATGVLQSVRLVGTPAQLFSVDHGRYLTLKLVVLGVMLKVADINRQRVARRFLPTTTPPALVVQNLRRAMGTELAVGLMVVAVTSAMVVSPPAVAEEIPTAMEAAQVADDFGLIAAVDPTVTSAPPESVPTTRSDAAPSPPEGADNAGTETCVLSGATALQFGASGDDVRCLQQVLRAAGLLEGDNPGTFDAATDAAVRSLQQDRGLGVDGVVGQVTATALGIWPTT